MPEHVGSEEGSGEVDAPVVRGAVLTVLTIVGPTAPAATQDRLGFVRVVLSSDAPDVRQVDLPIGGSAMLAVPEVEGAAIVEAIVFAPDGVAVGSNRLEIEQMSGSVGVLSLEVGSMATRRACRRCSDPDPLTEVRGLRGTLVFWSAGASIVGIEEDERLHVAMRAAVSEGERRSVIEAAGGRVVEEAPRVSAGLVWLVVRAAESTDLLEVAVALSRQPEVRGIERYRAGRSGALLVPLESAK